MGEKGIGRKLMVMRVPAPATMPGKMGWPAGRGGGGAKAASSMRAFCQAGMSRGRFSGLEKKAKTCSTG